MQYEKVKTFFSDIDKEKWNVAVGGKNEDKPGYFITPTIIDRPAEDSRIVTEEPFGPIVPLLKWTDEADVLRRANADKTGLGASHDGSRRPIMRSCCPLRSQQQDGAHGRPRH